MLGLGETEQEVRGVLADLRQAGVSIVTLGQYLRPTREHHPVARYVPPAEFEAWADQARALGFPAVYSGVFVRSSFNAEEVFHGAPSAPPAGASPAIASPRA
jgi:lipoyl synthase